MHNRTAKISDVAAAICLVKALETDKVGSKMKEKTAVMSCDLFIPRKSVRKKYSLEALSIKV